MIFGIGVDIVQINRMERWLKNRALLERYFHGDELALVALRESPQTCDEESARLETAKAGAAQTLAARFAAKEAFGKALGTGLARIALKDIIVYNDDNGKPEIKLTGTALEALEKSGAAKTHLSLSHEKENAIAMVVIERV